MSTRYLFSSLTRITDLPGRDFQVEPLDRDAWATGDYVVVEVDSRFNRHRLELASGRLLDLTEGDLVVGALGERHATLEATGTWREVEDDGRMHVLGGGGILGRCTSRSALLSPLSRVVYRGHVRVDGGPARMSDYGLDGQAPRPFRIPTVLIVGTSMSAGKTTTAQVVVRRLKEMGLRVLGAKITGAGRYRDVLAMYDAGADWIFDFVDAGIPSTIVPEDLYTPALEQLLSTMAATPADVAVVEAGASPLEPYNGAAAVRALRPAVRCTLLCASDPYAVLGVMTAFDARPDAVAGTASNTQGGRDLVRELTGLTALNVLDRRDVPALDALLAERLSPEGA